MINTCTTRSLKKESEISDNEKVAHIVGFVNDKI